MNKHNKFKIDFENPPKAKEWKPIVSSFAKPNLPKSIWQLINTVGLYVLLWVAMWFCTRPESTNWWLTIPMAIIAGAVLVRVFIICHDCGHGAFFKNQKANHITGFITGALAFTPYFHWRNEHNIHHAHNGNLTKRGIGDIWTMTVKEYMEADSKKRFSYKLGRNPFVIFLIGPLFTFVIQHRIPVNTYKKREVLSVWQTNIALVLSATILILLFGWQAYLIIQLTIITVAATAGVWLFYVQHQFEDTYWEHGDDWDFFTAAIKGSSFYKLPKVLQWFSGNIGYHHIHHLSAKIPNYHLEECHESHPMFQQQKPLTLWQSFKCVNYRLWDEENRRLITFKEFKKEFLNR